jgi:pyrimidine operon attenuation protein/uracil phosphoribosyltransferase
MPLQPPVQDATLLLDASAIERALRRIAHEIIERAGDLEKIALIGIPSRGVELARRIAGFVEQIEKVRVEHGAIDVSMHRDDLRLRSGLPTVAATHLPLQLGGRTIVLVDDVAFTGRTCRAAMDALSSFGRPAQIQFVALIDRGHRELPIRPDYVGKNLPTARGERIFVRLTNVDPVEADGIWLAKAAEPR